MINNDDTKRISVRFSKRLKAEMHKTILKKGYGFHGKSKWLKDVISSFKTLNDLSEYVDFGADIHQGELDALEAFTIDKETRADINDIILAVRKQIPLFEGVKSAVIRSAVIYGLPLKFPIERI